MKLVLAAAFWTVPHLVVLDGESGFATLHFDLLYLTTISLLRRTDQLFG